MAKVAVIGDITQLFIGYFIVFAYVMIMLGKFSCIEQRAYLAISSISGIIMGIIVAYGFCSSIGLFYGPMHNVLPFLLLGIGIDDMFEPEKPDVSQYLDPWADHPSSDEFSTPRANGAYAEAD